MRIGDGIEAPLGKKSGKNPPLNIRVLEAKSCIEVSDKCEQTNDELKDNLLTLFFGLIGGGRGGIESLWSTSEKQSSDNLLTLFFG